MSATPIYDELVEELGDPYREPEVPEDTPPAPAAKRGRSATPRKAARRKR